MGRYRMGIIGCGRALMLQMPGVLEAEESGMIDLRAVCDTREEALTAFSGKYNQSAGYADANTMLGKEALDIVLICTPPETHRELLEVCLRNGAHVIVEKPAASSLQELDEMMAIVGRYSAKVMVNENYRWFTDSVVASEAIDKGYIGEPLWARIAFASPEFRGYQFTDPTYTHWMSRTSRQIFLEQAVHWLDLFQHWLREDPQEVYAVFPKPKRWKEQYDPDFLSIVQVRYANGKSALMEQNYITHSPRPSYEAVIEGEEGTIHIVWDLQMRDSAAIEIHGERMSEPGCKAPLDSIPGDWVQQIDARRWGRRYGARWIAGVPCLRGKGPFRRGSVVAILRSLIDCLENGGLPLTNLQEERKVLQVLFGAYQSAETGRPVALAIENSKSVTPVHRRSQQLDEK